MSGLDIPKLTRRIREEALKLGFFQAGFVSIKPLPHEADFNAWLEKGFHGEMHYLDRQAPKRRNPALVLDNARSLVVLGMNYYQDSIPSNTPINGKISRYAWGNDYHSVVKDRMEKLLEFIRSQVPEAKGRCHVDAGPVMEKAWGAAAALGWTGKHTILIARNHGSWFFIGVILLDIDLGCTRESKDYCGTCRRCIQACPTKALVAPYVLDARRCVSYLTVEFRGMIPRALRALMGNRIYGCDECQEVCPWNRFAVPTPLKELALQEDDWTAELMSLASLTQEEFDRRFKNSPIRRITRDRFVRNVVIALGNASRIESLPVLEAALRDSSPLVRAHAVWALTRLPAANLQAILESARAKENDAGVLEEIASAFDPTPE